MKWGLPIVVLSLLAAASSLDGMAFPQRGASQCRATRRNVTEQALPGEPARNITLMEVTYPPGEGSPPHVHANGVMAFVVSGTIASKVGEEPERVFHAGDAWWEPPGAIHRVSRNASHVEAARLLAIYIAPKGATGAELMKPL